MNAPNSLRRPSSRASLPVLLALLIPVLRAADLPVVPVPDWQPFAAQVRRVAEALALAGALSERRSGRNSRRP